MKITGETQPDLSCDITDVGGDSTHYGRGVMEENWRLFYKTKLPLKEVEIFKWLVFKIHMVVKRRIDGRIY